MITAASPRPCATERWPGGTSLTAAAAQECGERQPRPLAFVSSGPRPAELGRTCLGESNRGPRRRSDCVGLGVEASASALQHTLRSVDQAQTSPASLPSAAHPGPPARQHRCTGSLLRCSLAAFAQPALSREQLPRPDCPNRQTRSEHRPVTDYRGLSNRAVTWATTWRLLQRAMGRSRPPSRRWPLSRLARLRQSTGRIVASGRCGCVEYGAKKR
jgi:hypothetical protein